jgi:hypothetical protein
MVISVTQSSKIEFADWFGVLAHTEITAAVLFNHCKVKGRGSITGEDTT